MAQVTQCLFKKNPPFTQTKWANHAATEGSWGGTQNTQLHVPAQPRKGLCHTLETHFPLSHSALFKPCSLPPLSWYSNQSTQLKTWKDIKHTELCQEPSQKWQFLCQSDNSLISINGNVGLDGIPRQIQGVPSGSHMVHHQLVCQVLKMYKLWAERSPNLPTTSFRSQADPKKEFWFQCTRRCLSTQCFQQ